jgi:hypothetical protein
MANRVQPIRNIMTDLKNLTVQQLQKAVAIKEQIERLQTELGAILGNGGTPFEKSDKAETAPKTGRKMSAAGRARIAAAARARWARFHSQKGDQTEATPGKRRRKMSAAAKAKIAAAARARWAKAKAAGKNAF